MTTQETIELFDRYVIANYTRNPVVLVRGKGAEIWDADGKRYLDMFPGWAVDALGHCHPKVSAAIKEQADILLHVANNFYMEPQAKLAKLLSESSFGGKCFFCNSGAEATESALKLARLNYSERGKYKVVTMENSFHGRTFAAITATGQPKYQKGFGPLLEGFSYVPFNDLGALEKAVDEQTCAVMMEPIQGEGGINIATQGFAEGVRQLCDDRDILLIFDEVQTGMGRTGKYFGYQHYGVTPDIMTLAKALGGGVAIGAIVAKPEVAEALKPGTHASTFGGNPLVCAAGVAVFEALEGEGLLENAQKMGDYAMAELRKLQEKFDIIKEVRGVGLMIGVELSIDGSEIVRQCMERGLLINCTHDTVIRFMAPMIVNQGQIDEALGTLDGVLADGKSDA